MRARMQQIVAGFKTSKPVFRIRKSYGQNLETVQEKYYRPEPSNKEDPIECLLCANYSESFNGTLFCTNNRHIIDRTIMDILGHIVTFFRNYSGLSHVNKSNVYKWLARGKIKDQGAEDALLLLYSHLVQFCEWDNTMALKASTIQGYSSEKLAENAIRILELMRHKYEK